MAGDGSGLSGNEPGRAGGAGQFVPASGSKRRVAFQLGTAGRCDAETRAVQNVGGGDADGCARVALALVRFPPGNGNPAGRGGIVRERAVPAGHHGDERLDLEPDEPDGPAADARHGCGLHHFHPTGIAPARRRSRRGPAFRRTGVDAVRRHRRGRDSGRWDFPAIPAWPAWAGCARWASAPTC